MVGARSPAKCESLVKNRQLYDLLDRDGEPASELVVDSRFDLKIDWHVQERARGGDDQAIGRACFRRPLEAGEHRAEVGAPDVSPVDASEREHEFGRGASEDAPQ